MCVHIYIYIQYTYTHTHTSIRTHLHIYINNKPEPFQCRAQSVGIHLFQVSRSLFWKRQNTASKSIPRDIVRVTSEGYQHRIMLNVKHINESGYLFMLLFTRMNESCHACGWVMSHVWMSDVTHMNESAYTYEWVMSPIWMSHVMSHFQISHVTHMNELCHAYRWFMSHM